jgi:hypothetical protein
MTAGCRWNVESGKLMYQSMFEYVPTCVYMIINQMSYSFPNSRRSSTCPWYTLGRKMVDKNLEQWVNISFCVKIGKSASETLALLTFGYGEYSMKKLSVFERHRRFKEGREDVQDKTRSGQPETQRRDANMDRVQTLMHSDRRLGVTQKCSQAYGNLFRGHNPNFGLTSGFSTMTMPLCMMC